MTGSLVAQELRELIRQQGSISFADFQQVCLYSPNGGFYSTRAETIGSHFRTSATGHTAFGALIARQLEQMWRLLGRPRTFHVIEVGSGDGSLARSIGNASHECDRGFFEALYYVAADYGPWWPAASSATGAGDSADPLPHAIQRVQAQGLRGFNGITGCILSNELIDNLPVHRFAIEGSRVKEVRVTSDGNAFVEVLAEPSTPRLESRLVTLGIDLPDGLRGEVSLAAEDWMSQVAGTLHRGFALTIDYGELAADLYAQNPGGTVVTFSRHIAGTDPYVRVGEQDITTQVDFTSLMRLGEAHGLANVGYTRQSDFLGALGFAGFLEALENEEQSPGRLELRRMVLTSLVDPDELGNLKVLAQAKGMGTDVVLDGFGRARL